jgi:threonine synthase
VLRCYACGETRTTGQRCDCGEPLWFDTDPSEFEWPAASDDRVASGVGAFADLLPIDPPSHGLAAAPGDTPLVREPALDADGVRVHLKLEGTNPTGSFKDRGSAVGVAAVEQDHPTIPNETEAVGTVSHGNMAVSVSAHAASAGLPAVVLVPSDISAARLERIAAHGPQVYRVDGDYGRLYHDALAVGPDAGVAFLNSDSPLRVAGQKTTALEVLQSFALGHGDEANAPDAMIVPVSSGGHASGTWKAVREVQQAGLIDDPPRLYFVQASACAPIADAAARGDEEVTRLESGETEETVAYSIANADPPSGTRALHGARATGGDVVAVDDDEILDAHERLADVGYRVEVSCATVLAAFDDLRERDEIARGDDVVLVATGVGYGSGDGSVTADAPVVSRETLPDVL